MVQVTVKVKEKNTGMLQRDGRVYNCAESTIIQINDKHPLPGFGKDTLRIVSVTGGGVSLSGSACGVVVGITTALGLAYGNDGTEPPEEFAKKRGENFMLGRGILNEFREKFGGINCVDLTGFDLSTDDGLVGWSKRSDDYKEKNNGSHHCDKYVEWAVDRVLAQLKA